jgi:hypothetical protein
VSSKRSGKVAKVPIHGKAAHNMAFLVSIGNLIVNWANNESVFMAMLQALLAGGKLSAAIIWHSHRTTQARLELVSRLCREQVHDQALVQDIQGAISAFKKLSRTRNFYCHATYHYDRELNLSNASGTTLTQEGDPLAFEVKRMDVATLNEIGHVSTELGTLNRRLWVLVDRLQTSLGVQRVELPPLPPEQK